MAAAAILDFFEPKIAPLDPPSPKTPPETKHEVDRMTGGGDIWPYGSPRLSDFSPLGSGGQTPQRTITQNGLNDVFSRKDVPFAVKSLLFIPPDLQAPKRSKFGKFLDLENFRSI